MLILTLYNQAGKKKDGKKNLAEIICSINMEIVFILLIKVIVIHIGIFIIKNAELCFKKLFVKARPLVLL